MITRIDLAPALVLDDLARAGRGHRRPRGRAAAHRPPAPAELQLLDAQHRAPHQAAGRATSSSCTPTDLAPAGSRGRRHRHGHVARRHGRVEVAATDDMMPGVVCLPHGYGHAEARDDARRAGPGGVDQRPDRPRAARRHRQRGTQRRARHRQRVDPTPASVRPSRH